MGQLSVFQTQGRFEKITNIGEFDVNQLSSILRSNYKHEDVADLGLPAVSISRDEIPDGNSDGNDEFDFIIANALKLVAEYDAEIEKCRQLNGVLNNGELRDALSRFFTVERYEVTHFIKPASLETVISHLNVEYWEKVFNSLKMNYFMPSDDLKKWYEDLKSANVPDFTLESILNTAREFISERANYLAKRAKSVFDGLSNSHVTNAPSCFGERLIIENMTSPREYHHINSNKAAKVTDLRFLLDVFLVKELDLFTVQASRYLNFSDLLKIVIDSNRFGEWVEADLGAFKFKLFKKGTLHIEISPELSWKLNKLLALNYSMAIPAEFRRRPEKPQRQFKQIHELINYRLSKECLFLLKEIKPFLEPDPVFGMDRPIRIENTYYLTSPTKISNATRAEVTSVLESIGCTITNKYRFLDYIVFECPSDLDCKALLDDIILLGVMPDYKSHQWYPTNSEDALELVQMAEIEPFHECLEPEAGRGDIAIHMPQNTVCVEISKFHFSTLLRRGFENAINEDFLEWSRGTTKRFDRIVSNPPFKDFQWLSHLNASLSLLKKSGICTAILPCAAIMSGCEIEGYEYQWGKVEHGRFENTNVSTIKLKVTRIQ